MRALPVLASVAAGGVAAAALFVALAAGSELRFRGCLSVAPSHWRATADCTDAAVVVGLAVATALILCAMAVVAARRAHA